MLPLPWELSLIFPSAVFWSPFFDCITSLCSFSGLLWKKKDDNKWAVKMDDVRISVCILKNSLWSRLLHWISLTKSSVWDVENEKMAQSHSWQNWTPYVTIKLKKKKSRYSITSCTGMDATVIRSYPDSCLGGWRWHTGTPCWTLVIWPKDMWGSPRPQDTHFFLIALWNSGIQLHTKSTFMTSCSRLSVSEMRDWITNK